MPWKLSPSLLDKDFAWAVVPGSSVGKLDVVTTNCHRLEEGRCGRGRLRDLLSGVSVEINRHVVCRKKGRSPVRIQQE